MSYGKFGVGGCCCGCDVIIHVLCLSSDIAGAIVSVDQLGSEVASGTTDGSGLVTLTIPAPGPSTITVDTGGTYPTCSFDRDLACDDTVDVQLCCVVTANITACPGQSKNGALVNFTGVDQSASCTTDATGTCSVTLGCESGPVTVTPSKAGCNFNPPSLSAACGDSISFQMACGTANGQRICVKGCNGAAIPGATVNVTGPETWSGTTDATGCIYFPPTVAGMHNFSIDAGDPRYKVKTGSFLIVNLCDAQSGNVTLDVADDYFCSVCCDGPLPVPKSFFETDDAGGTAVASTPFAAGQWVWCREGVPSARHSVSSLKTFCTCRDAINNIITAQIGDPTDIAAGSTPVMLTLTCVDNLDGTTSWTLRQSFIVGATFRADCCLTANCSTALGSNSCNPAVASDWTVDSDCATLVASGGSVTVTADSTVTTPADCDVISLSFTFSDRTGGTFAPTPIHSVLISS